MESGDDGPWIDVGSPADIPDDRARTVCASGGERIAVFKHKGAITAVTTIADDYDAVGCHDMLC